MRLLLSSLLFANLCTYTPFAGAQDAAAAWKAGLGKATITPEKLMWMSGYAARNKPAEGKEHDLWAKALFLEDGNGKRAVLITLDLVGIDRGLSQLICKSLEDKFGLGRENIILSVSHTHSGPVVGDNLSPMYFLDAEQHARIKEYAEFLPRQIITAVADAEKNLAKAELSWGIGRATFAVNRRNNSESDVLKLKEGGQLKGPVDHDVPILALRDLKGTLRGILFGYACHATVLDYYKWNGDYPGYAQIELEKSHPGAVAMFFAGCGGDQNPLPRRRVELAEQYGKQLAAAVDSVIQEKMHRVRGDLACRYVEIPLAFDALPAREKLAADTQSKNKYLAHHARALLEKMQQEQEIPATYPYPVQVWRLGNDLALVALGGEVVVDYALRIKKELRPGNTWVMGYANDVMAYIPSLRVLKEGGYEGGGAMIYYGLPTVWSPRVEEAIMRTVHSEMKKISKPRLPKKTQCVTRPRQTVQRHDRARDEAWAPKASTAA